MVIAASADRIVAGIVKLTNGNQKEGNMKKNSRRYCTQNDGDCETCSLVNYGLDCHNQPVTARGDCDGCQIVADISCPNWLCLSWETKCKEEVIS